MREHAYRSAARPRLASFAGWTSILLLVASLLLAQTSALMHRVVHGPSGAVHVVAAVYVPSVSANASTNASANADASSTHWLTHAWGDHAQRSDCQFFDQLACVALPVTQVVLPVWALPAFVALWQAHGPQTLSERFYSAQAPPVPV